MAKLSPVFNGQLEDENGAPLVGGKLYTYAAGSSTAQPTYTTSAGDVPQANPIILNADGKPDNAIWLTEGLTYKFILKDANDVTKQTVDNIAGVNDASIDVSQWITSGATPTYVSATSYTVAGDQTTEFHVGRRQQFTVTAGTVYGAIASTAYNGSSLTTVTMTMGSGQSLDTGLTAVNHSILRADNLALPSVINRPTTLSGASLITAKGATIAAAATTNIFSAKDGDVVDISGDTAITSFGTAAQAGQRITGRFTGAPLITASADLILNTAASSIQIEAGDSFALTALTTTQHALVVTRKSGASVGSVTATPPVRQTVLSGPVDTSGLSAFGGSTGSTTVTASGTLVATAANGTADRTGSITNPSWTSLSTNGTMYLYLDIAADGTCTTGSGTLVPTYQWGGSDVTTNGKFTFNIQEMAGKVGNGSAAVQTYRVYVGEVTVSGGVVTGITWYALRGRYEASANIPAAGTATSRNHNLGVQPRYAHASLVNTIAVGGYSVGDEVYSWTENNAGTLLASTTNSTRLTVATIRGSTSTLYLNKNTGVSTTLGGDWTYKFVVERGW